ncbi:MAG: LamG-like jellyroll fold domain-containing protein [Sedimentisphaeraceae bacterium JB056]
MKMQLKIVQLFLTVLLVVAVGQTFAEPLTDDSSTIALWHMDETVPVGSSQRPYVIDDNSVTSRAANNIALGDNANTASKYPTLTTGDGGMYGEALQFSSAAKNMMLANGAWDGFDAVRVELWFNQDVAATGDQTVISAMEGAVWEIRLDSTNSVAKAYVFGTTGGYAVAAVSYTKGQWTHVVLTASTDEDVLMLNIDGSVDTRNLNNGINIQTGKRIYVGCKQTDNRNFDGLIDEVKVSLPPSTAYLQPYEDAFGTYALWHMDEAYESSDKLYIVDDNSANPSRQYNLLFLHNGGAARPGEGTGPQIVPAMTNNWGADFGSALYFNGLNHTTRVNIADDNLGIDGTNFKIEAWVKLDDSIGTYGANKRYYITTHNSRFALYLQDSASGWQLISSNWWSTGAHAMVVDYPDHTGWHHISTQWYEGDRKLYLDGELVKTHTAPDTSVKDGVGYLYVGSQATTANLFYGIIDELRISQAVDTAAPCGYWGYHTGDLNKDCYVDIEDLKMIVDNWLSCSVPDQSGCIEF